MNNLKEFEVCDLSKVVGGYVSNSVKGTVEVTGVLDGVRGNTKVKVDVEVDSKK